MAAVIAIGVFYIGKNHDLTISFIDKIAEIEKIQTSLKTKPSNAKSLDDCKKTIKIYELKLTHLKQTPGIMI